MGLNGSPKFEAQKVHPLLSECSTQFWGVNKGLLKRSDAFV